MEIRELREPETEEALVLVWEVFSEFEAPVYSTDGVEAFRRFLHSRKELARLRFLGAWDGAALIGVIAARGDHISLFFVRKEWHRRDVGRALFQALCAAAACGEWTVNAAPGARKAYQKLGFVPVDEERIADGIRYIPMHCKKESRLTFQGGTL